MQVGQFFRIELKEVARSLSSISCTAIGKRDDGKSREQYYSDVS